MKLSLILPSLNVKKYIYECIDSACNQSIREIEILCIDAGSTDGTIDIIKEFAQKDARVKYIHSDIKSYGHQVNIGLGIAKGDYIAILETDDYVEKRMYETLYNKAVEYDCDYVKADYDAYWTQPSGERFFISRHNLNDSGLYNRILEPLEHLTLCETDWYLWTGIYKRAFLRENNILFTETPGAAFQDIGFLFKTISSAKRAYYLKDSLYRYCIDREDASSNSGRGILYSKYEFEQLLKFDQQLSVNACMNNRRSCLYLRMIKSSTSLLSNSDGNFSHVSLNEYLDAVDWFKKQIDNALKEDLKLDDISSDLYNKLTVILGNEQEQFVKVKSNRNKIKNAALLYKNVIIFGCGNFGFIAYKWIVNNSIELAGFMDNNSLLWDKSLCDVKVHNPQDAPELSKNSLIIIANDIYADSIRKQLIELGVSENDILVFM